MALLSAPVVFSLPFACAVLRRCPYGLDALLFWTHAACLSTAALAAVHRPLASQAWSAFGARVTGRILWLPAALACAQALLLRAGVTTAWRGPRHAQRDQPPEEVTVSSDLTADSSSHLDPSTPPLGGPPHGAARKPGAALWSFAAVAVDRISTSDPHLYFGCDSNL